MDEIMLKVDNVSKMYKLGQIGGTTLRDELQRLGAKLRHKEDPTQLIGAKSHTKNETFMALNGVSFEVKKGERVGIIGHNGAGKSTLLKLISRITAPTSGTISMNGRVASMLEVGTGFNGELTGRENIYMNGAILGMTKKEIDAKIEDIIEFSECRQFIDTPVKRYSSGMYVKLAFSVAAHLDSEIMIMDEVLAVGDMAFQKKCLGKMGDEAREGKTILYVSHNMATIRQLCNRVIVLERGSIVYDGDMEKAISIYEGEVNRGAIDIDVSKLERRKGINQRALIKRFRLLKCTSNTYFEGAHLQLQIDWENYKECDGLYYRFFIYNSSGLLVTTAVHRNLLSVESGHSYSHQFDIDLMNLAPDTYHIGVRLTDINSLFLSDYDWIDDVCTIQIISTNDNDSFFKLWSTHSYGMIRSGEVICKEIG